MAKMPERGLLPGRLLGSIYGCLLVAVTLYALVSGGGWNTRQGGLYAGLLMLFIAGGFLLARHFHQQSPVFRLFYGFGKLQTSGGSLRDRCLMNFFILDIVGLLLTVLSLVDVP